MSFLTLVAVFLGTPLLSLSVMSDLISHVPNFRGGRSKPASCNVFKIFSVHTSSTQLPQSNQTMVGIELIAGGIACVLCGIFTCCSLLCMQEKQRKERGLPPTLCCGNAQQEQEIRFLSQAQDTYDMGYRKGNEAGERRFAWYNVQRQQQFMPMRAAAAGAPAGQPAYLPQWRTNYSHPYAGFALSAQQVYTL
jgi:hypothetical protein